MVSRTITWVSGLVAKAVARVFWMVNRAGARVLWWLSGQLRVFWAIARLVLALAKV